MRYLKLGIFIVLLVTGMPMIAAEVLSLPQAIQMALEHRIEMQTAKLSRQSASLGLTVAESQLDWQATAAAGWKHGLDTQGQPTEQHRLSAGLIKQQRSGNQISVQGNYQKDESETAGASLFLNPTEAYGVNLDYRIPLQKGKGNLAYAYAEAQARMGIAISKAEQHATAERVSEQLINIYHQLLNLQIQIDENQRAIKRTGKLETYIAKNSRLGLAEEKDRLSVRARLAAQRADEKRLEREWVSKVTELQKMIGSVQSTIQIVNYDSAASLPSTLEKIQHQVVQRDAVIASNNEKLALAQSQLQLNRDKQNNKLDMVVSLGNETREGQRSGSTLDENEWVGGVRLEYQFPIDRRGVDATTLKTLIELDQIRLDGQRYENDLNNQLRQWHQEFQVTSETTQLYRLRKSIEALKYKEVKGRYLEGRTDIREMLEAEESLTIAEQLLAREEARRSLVLALLSNRVGLIVPDKDK